MTYKVLSLGRKKEEQQSKKRVIMRHSGKPDLRVEIEEHINHVDIITESREQEQESFHCENDTIEQAISYHIDHGFYVVNMWGFEGRGFTREQMVRMK